MNLNDYKSPGDIEAEILMMRSVHTGSFLLVEGDDDIRFWTSRVADGECELVDGNGKPNVEGALERLDVRNFPGVLGIVDNDFDSLECRSMPSNNLITTDAHDLESMLLRSPALDRVLAEYGSKKKIRRFEEIRGCTVRNVLLNIGTEFGLLRWLSRRAGWPYLFGNNGPARFVDTDSWSINRDILHTAVVEDGVYPTIATLRAELARLPPGDPWAICQGHDLLGILRIGLMKMLGNLKPSKGVGDIAAMLRSAFDTQQLQTGHLGISIRAWEGANVPYRILETSHYSTARP